ETESDERPTRPAQGKQNGSAIEELRRRFDYRQKQKSQQNQPFGRPQTERSGAPDPALVQTPRPSIEGLRRLGVRPASDDAPQTAPSDYAVGQKVEHPKFGVGEILRIETLATDHKLVVSFGTYGEKTLLAKFAKLTKL
ncbi:MAG: ATP-dependent DNA helicase, partial [Alistipes sp.]